MTRGVDQVRDIRVPIRDLAEEDLAHFRIDEIPVPARLLDPVSEEYLAVNQASCDLYGYTRDEFLRLTVQEIVHPDDLEGIRLSIRSLEPRSLQGRIWRHRHRSGRILQIEHFGQVVEHRGKPAWLMYSIDRTAEAEAQAAQEAAERRVAVALESLGDAFYTLDADFRFSYLNPQCYLAMRVPAKDLIGRTIWEAFPKLRDEWYAGFIEKVMRDRISIHFETAGDEAHYEVDIRPTPDGIAVSYRDITERKREEARKAFLLDLSDRIRGLADPKDVMWGVVCSVGQFFGVSRATYGEIDESDEYVVVDRDYVNGTQPIPGAHRLNSFGPEVIDALRRGETVAVEEISCDPRTAAFADAYQAIGVRSLLCVPMVRQDRFRALLVLHHKLPRAWDPADIDLMESVADRTWHAVELARSLQEIKRLNEDLEERVRIRTAELQAAKDEMEGFCYSVSHDLRTPLRAMMATSRILIEDHEAKLDGDAANQLDRLGRAAKRMGDLIDDLLQFSRLSRSELTRSLVDLSTIAVELCEEMAERYPRRKGGWSVQPGLWAHADPQMIRLVLQNLIENAFKFSAHADEPTVSFGREDGSYYVRDNGVGFDAQYAHKLFRPFERLHADEQYPGTGIGLANVKRIVERHHGRVYAESEPGHGTTFWFTLEYGSPTLDNESQSRRGCRVPRTTQLPTFRPRYPSPVSERLRWPIVWLLALLPLLGWWATGLLDLDEGFYAAATAEMNRRGEWVTPYYNGSPWFEKPILLYWFAKPSIALFGESIGPRLPSVLASLATYLLLAWFARRHFKDAVAKLAVLILASSLLVVGAGRMMLTDPLLVLCFTGAMVTFWESLVGDRRWRLATAGLLGFGVLAKGPVALILFVLIAGWTFFRERELRAEFRGQWLAGTAILAAVIATWYVPAYLASGETFVQKFLIEQNIGRFTGGDAAHTLGLASLPLYIPILFLGMVPWAAWIPKAWPRQRDRGEQEPLRRFLGTWALMVFLFFSVSGAKLPHYILPVIPPLALLLAERLSARRWSAGLGVAMCVAMSLIANGALWWWYQASGQQEVHNLARYVRAQGGEVTIYQMSRRNKDRGTGRPKLQETSLPSLFLYLNSTALDTDDLSAILAKPAGTWVITRADRIGAEEMAQAARAGRTLERVRPPLRQENFAIFRVQ